MNEILRKIRETNNILIDSPVYIYIYYLIEHFLPENVSNWIIHEKETLLLLFNDQFENKIKIPRQIK